MSSDSGKYPRVETIVPFKGHEKFLDLAARQLNLRGVELTSLDEIASKLGVSRATLGHFIEGRHDLVFQCYERAAHCTARRLFEATREGGSSVSILRNFVTRMLDPAQPEIAVQSEMAMMSASQRDTIEGLYDAVVARLAYLIEDGTRANEFRACDVHISARIVLSVISWAQALWRWLSATGAFERERLIAQATALIIEGLEPQPDVSQIHPLDLSGLRGAVIPAFDREAALNAKREALMRKASLLLNAKGIEATSLEDVAAASGVTLRALVDHFGSKRDLVMSCYQRAYRIFLFGATQLPAHPGSRLDAVVAGLHAAAMVYPDPEIAPLSPGLGYATLSAEDRMELKSIRDAGERDLSRGAAARCGGRFHSSSRYRRTLAVTGGSHGLARAACACGRTEESGRPRSCVLHSRPVSSERLTPIQVGTDHVVTCGYRIPLKNGIREKIATLRLRP